MGLAANIDLYESLIARLTASHACNACIISKDPQLRTECALIPETVIAECEKPLFKTQIIRKSSESMPI